MDIVSWFHDYFYLPVHAALENFISNNEELTDFIGAPSDELLGRDLIGDGITIGDMITDTNTVWDGTNDSLLGALGWFGDLHDGGFLFGDSGAGAVAVAASTVVSAATPDSPASSTTAG